MGETVKFHTFCNEPMGNKSIKEVPGVGPIAAKKLISINYNKATDLYDRLEKLDFDEKKFRVWITIKCKGAKVSTIFNALKGWHAQFQGRDGAGGNARASTPHARPGGRAVRKSTLKRARNSVQFDCSSGHQPSSSSANDTVNPNNALTLFFASFADSCKNISPEYHTDLKMEILGVVAEYEKKSRESQNRPSTSYAMNGV